MSVKNWSTTAGSNASVDSINFAEGQTPSSVNNSARALMADVKEWYDQITAGTISGTVGGAADAVTLTTTPTVGAYAVNQRYLFKAGAANTVSNPTLNVSSLGTKTIVAQGGGALPVPAWATGDMVLVAYDGTNMMLVGTTSYVGSASGILRNAQTGTTYTVLTGDRGKWITYANGSAVAVTLPQANSTTFGAGWYSWHENIGAGTVTITPTTSNINGAGGTALVLRTGEWALIQSDNANYRAVTNGRVTGLPSARETGTRGLPVATQDADYTFAIGDEGGIIRHASASTHTYTIPANGTVAFPVGTAITVINEPGAGAITLAITTDTLNRGDGIAGTGSRTIAASSLVTIVKTSATTWMISGAYT